MVSREQVGPGVHIAVRRLVLMVLVALPGAAARKWLRFVDTVPEFAGGKEERSAALGSRPCGVLAVLAVEEVFAPYAAWWPLVPTARERPPLSAVQVQRVAPRCLAL